MKKLGAVRIIYAVLYSITSVINTILAIRSPQVLKGLSETAYFPFLRHLLATVPDFMYPAALLDFAVYQITLVTLLLSRRHYRLGLLGGIIFHLGIIPFGPFNLPNLLIALPLILKLATSGSGSPNLQEGTVLNPKLKPAYILSLIISILVLAATAGGLFLSDLYRDNALITMGWIWNDLITLVIALPVLAGALFHSIRGSQRAQLVWLGMLYYTIYNYAFYLFGAVLNRFFLIYSALFTLPAFALIYGLSNANLDGIGRKFRDGIYAKGVSVYMMFMALGLGSVWVSQMVGFVITGHLPPSVLGEGGLKLVASLDLSFQVPGMALAAIWLWQRRPWGYGLATVLNLQGGLYSLVLTAGTLAQMKAGVEGAEALLPLWIFFATASLISTAVLLWNLPPTGKAEGTPHLTRKVSSGK